MQLEMTMKVSFSDSEADAAELFFRGLSNAFEKAKASVAKAITAPPVKQREAIPAPAAQPEETAEAAQSEAVEPETEAVVDPLADTETPVTGKGGKERKKREPRGSKSYEQSTAVAAINAPKSLDEKTVSNDGSDGPKKYTYDDLKALGRQLVQEKKNGNELARKILDGFGVQRVTDIPEERIGEMRDVLFKAIVEDSIPF